MWSDMRCVIRQMKKILSPILARLVQKANGKKRRRKGSFGIKSSLPEEIEESNLMGILTAWRMLCHQGAIAYLPLHGKGT